IRAPISEDAGAASGDIVFVGYGVVAPDHGRDDFAGADVRGKIALVFAGLPTGTAEPPEPVRAQGARLAKIANALRAGADGIVIIYDTSVDDDSWRAARAYVGRSAMRIDGTAPDTQDALVAALGPSAGETLAG